jgi:hypothetical protein
MSFSAGVFAAGFPLDTDLGRIGGGIMLDTLDCDGSGEARGDFARIISAKDAACCADGEAHGSDGSAPVHMKQRIASCC